MVKKILLSSLLLLSATASLATRPIRTIQLRQADGSIVTTPYRHASEDSPIEPFSFQYLKGMGTRAMTATSPDGLGVFGVRSNGVLNSIGEHNIPVMMVEFQDVEFAPENTPIRVDSLFNHPGFAQTSTARGSVRDYFLDQSYNMFRPKFTVVGKFKAKNTRAYYGANSGNNKNLRALELYSEMTAAAVTSGVDFSPYLEDGAVPLVVLFYAGAGEHNAFETGSENYIWAHFRETSTQAGSVKFKSYFMGNELYNIYKSKDGSTILDDKGNPIVESSRLDGIGVLCHELSHALGLPDTYTTNPLQNVVYKTPDFFDIMDYGQWGSSGYRPVGYSAYQRNMLGWLALEELKEEAGDRTLEKLNEVAASEVPKAYIIRNPNKESEYFIFENRQDSKWFDVRFGKGMLVFHVDYDEDAWKYNRPNNEAENLRYVVVPADGQWQNNRNAGGYAPYKSDFFPGTNGVTEFSADAAPVVLWKSGDFQTPIYNIAETADGLITFSYLQKTPNAISSVSSERKNNAIYTLDGRRAQQEDLKAGVYIQGGKKIVVK